MVIYLKATYVAITWQQRTQKVKITEKVAPLQIIVSFALTKLMSLSASLVLEALLDLPSLHVVVKREVRLIAFGFSQIATHSGPCDQQTIGI